MPAIPCIIDGKEGILLLKHTSLTVLEDRPIREYSYHSIRSVHVKNTDMFLLKIRFEEDDSRSSSFVCSFRSMHLRDFLKMLILTVSISSESLHKSAVDHNLELKNMYVHARQFLKTEQLLKLAKASSKLPGVFLEPELYVQRGTSETLDESSIRQLQKCQSGGATSPAQVNILHAFSQPLIDTFILMNCSLSQFLNLIFSSYFYDPKNKKNTLDRILAENIRGFHSEVDCATRINSYSFMALRDRESPTGTVRERKTGEEPLPEYQIRVEERNEPDASMQPLDINEFVSPVKYEFRPGILEARHAFHFAPKDFETARELCRIVYCSGITEETEEFSRNFKVIIEGKYGEEAMPYITRLLPTFYARTESK